MALRTPSLLPGALPWKGLCPAPRRGRRSILPPCHPRLFLPRRVPPPADRPLPPGRLIQRKGRRRGDPGRREGWPAAGRPASARFKGRTKRESQRNWPPALPRQNVLKNGDVLHSNILRQNPLTCKEATSSTRSSEPPSRQRRLGLIPAAGINALF